MKFLRCRRVPVVMASVATLAMLASATGFIWQANEARQQRDFAITQLDRVEATTGFLRALLNAASPPQKTSAQLKFH